MQENRNIALGTWLAYFFSGRPALSLVFEQITQVAVWYLAEVHACLNIEKFQFMLGNNEFDFELVCEISVFGASHPSVLTHI